MIYAVGFTACLANAFKVLRPMPAVAPANTNVRPDWKERVEGSESWAFDARIVGVLTIVAVW